MHIFTLVIFSRKIMKNDEKLKFSFGFIVMIYDDIGYVYDIFRAQYLIFGYGTENLEGKLLRITPRTVGND